MPKVRIGIGDFVANVYDKDDKYIGRITNIDELLDFRVQIKEEQAEGYYMQVAKVAWGPFKTVTFDRNGTLSDYPDELNFSTDCLLKLV